jgi:tetratricopeptide (TPR) repeat protein
MKVTLVLLLLLVSARAHAMFMMPDIAEAPTARVITNLTRSLAKNTNDARLHYYLGRLHSMAAVQDATLSVLKTNGLPHILLDHGVPNVRSQTNAPKSAAERARIAALWTNSLRHFAQAIALLPKSTNADDAALMLPANLGYGWALQQAGHTNEAIRQYRYALKLAWARDVGSRLEELVDTVKWTVQTRQWHGWRQRTLMMGDVASEEIIGYLQPLLDPKRDAKEIAELKAKGVKLSEMPRAITPIVVPSRPGRQLEEVVDAGAAVRFDLDGSGLSRRWGWITGDGAWLVWDPHDRREIRSGLQLFGAVTFWVFWRDGYEALSALDDNGDGTLTGDELNGLALWHDRDGDGVSTRAEVTPVGPAGLTRLECTPQVHPSGIPFHPAGAGFGAETRPTFDWLAPENVVLSGR